MTNGSANAEQARYWTEDAGPSWVRDEVVYDLMLTPFNGAILDVLQPAPGERVLDVGCGFGSTSRAIAARGAEVHGIDISAPMIELARRRASEAGVDVAFAVGDAQEDDLGGPYDAVASRLGVMFFADPVRAFRNFARATRPGGRLVFVCWQTLDRNPWMSAASEVLRSLIENPPPPSPPGAGPFAFGEVEFLERVLTDAGWTGTTIAPFETSVHLGGNDGVEGAVEQVLSSSVAKALLRTEDPSLRDRAAVILRAQFAALSVDGDVNFPAAVWLVSARV